MRRTLTRIGLSLAAVLVPIQGWADNTSSGGAFALMVGGTPAEASVATAGPVERWYRTNLVAGRSYCAETQGGAQFDAGGFANTALTVYRSDATTELALNHDVLSAEPGGSGLSRVCLVSGFTELTYFKVSSFGGTNLVRVRIVETSLFSNWFFVGGDYGAYTLLRNTTNQTVSYVLTWRSASGAVLDTASGNLPANGSTSLNARESAAVLKAVSGTVEVVHQGSPGAILASTTVLSPTTGLSFDAPFAGIMGRQPW